MILDQEHLDQLAEFFDRSADGLTLTVSQDENGVVRLEYRTPLDDQKVTGGLFQFTLTDDTVDYDILNFAPEYRHNGFYRLAVKVLPDWMRGLGIVHWRIPLLVQIGGEFHSDVLDTGWVQNEDNTFEVDISSKKDSRLDQYNDWVHKGKSAPDWHTALPEKFRVTTDEEIAAQSVEAEVEEA